MGRPPCCEKMQVKKGPWTPEEDIILVSYIQQHGPGSWRCVPRNTGLLRCSKSCKLRWTNYLRPGGIKRGNFTEHEEKTIINLRALLGNRWAAISSYLPQRTDNDIKNHWNTHLKKKLNVQRQNGITNEDNTNMTEISSCDNNNNNNRRIANKGQWEKKLQTDINMAKQALFQALSLDQPSSSITPDPNSPMPHDHHYTTALYASSTDNISKLLQNWTCSSPSMPNTSLLSNNRSSSNGERGVLDHHSLFSSNSESGSVDEKLNLMTHTSIFKGESKSNADMEATNNAPNDDHGSFSLIEQWLFDDQGLVDQCDGDQEDLIDVSVEGKNNGNNCQDLS